jgi:hypothetical protein
LSFCRRGLSSSEAHPAGGDDDLAQPFDRRAGGLAHPD